MHCPDCGLDVDPEDSYCDGCSKMLGGSTGAVARSPTDLAADSGGRVRFHYVVGLASGVAGLVLHGAFAGVALGTAYFLYDAGERGGAALVGALGALSVLVQLAILALTWSAGPV